MQGKPNFFLRVRNLGAGYAPRRSLGRRAS